MQGGGLAYFCYCRIGEDVVQLMHMRTKCNSVKYIIRCPRRYLHHTSNAKIGPVGMMLQRVPLVRRTPNGNGREFTSHRTNIFTYNKSVGTCPISRKSFRNFYFKGQRAHTAKTFFVSLTVKLLIEFIKKTHTKRLKLQWTIARVQNSALNGCSTAQGA